MTERSMVRAKIFAEENRRWWTLGALCFALFMIMLDNTVVNVALPAIKSDLGISTAELEWTVAAYALTFASLLLTGGKLGDLLGRRLIFTIGLVIFTLSSLACGLSSTAPELIGARAVQGVGAALMMPATLSIISATFAARERGMAIGIWAGVSAMALAIGPLLGGIITEHISWNWIFFVNFPIYMQTFLGWSPIQAGAALLPWTLMIVIFAPIAGKLSDRVGSRWLMAGGMTVVAICCLLLSTVTLQSSFWNLLPAFVLG